MSAIKPSIPGVDIGYSFPLGARLDGNGVNFSVYSKHATAVELLLFDGPDAARPSRTIPLEPPHHRTYHYWHAHVAGLAEGQVYAYRAHGPDDPAKGLRFNADKVLFDPPTAGAWRGRRATRAPPPAERGTTPRRR